MHKDEIRLRIDQSTAPCATVRCRLSRGARRHGLRAWRRWAEGLGIEAPKAGGPGAAGAAGAGAQYGGTRYWYSDGTISCDR